MRYKRPVFNPVDNVSIAIAMIQIATYLDKTKNKDKLSLDRKQAVYDMLYLTLYSVAMHETVLIKPFKLLLKEVCDIFGVRDMLADLSQKYDNCMITEEPKINA